MAWHPNLSLLGITYGGLDNQSPDASEIIASAQTIVGVTVQPSTSAATVSLIVIDTSSNRVTISTNSVTIIVGIAHNDKDNDTDDDDFEEPEEAFNKNEAARAS